MEPMTTAMQTSLLRGADLIAAPWKNGGGVTREIAAYPHRAGFDTFIWRVSLADVAQPGPFSSFAGIDRTLVLLSGAGMLLDEAQGRTHALEQPYDIARFAGETAIDARLVDGATRDFNLMIRRDAATGDIGVWRDGESHRICADTLLLFCGAGSVDVALAGIDGSVALATNDTLRIDDARQASHCAVRGNGTVLAISIRYRQQAARA
ncbi:HutD family protein [Paraburkholderia sp. SARCC-3016]|uniref:HutD/Ves family protein n=1 Tax=Paraburkholderia sp. SARCC-3016 TaxID=3058611 RepID=UPI002808F8B4|nr:HutD family protein [Paraburkholderia sp. SARCC-3016]MDQ7977823.1 HutD family protein [Paraburkholderia sp. SARCC-3016]